MLEDNIETYPIFKQLIIAYEKYNKQVGSQILDEDSSYYFVENDLLTSIIDFEHYLVGNNAFDIGRMYLGIFYKNNKYFEKFMESYVGKIL